jgi:transcriptional regulator of acetoin/glycerol metabolism
MNNNTSLHAHPDRQRSHIESTLHGSGADSIIKQRIERSWRRCLDEHSLDPSRHRLAPVVDSAELRRRRISTAACYDIVRAQMLLMSRAFTRSAAIVFTDTDGVILFCIGESSFMAQAQRAGLRLGAVWSESEQGTNGMGTCLIERAPVVVEQQAHFLVQHAALTCFAAPILDPRGNLVGALDISSNYPLPKEPMLALLELAVTDVERRLLVQQSAGQSLLLFASRRAYVDTALEGAVSFDDAGVITGANRTAIRWLGASAHQDLCGKSLHSLFGIGKHLRELLDGPFRCRAALQAQGPTHYHCRIVSATATRPASAVPPASMRAAVGSAERNLLLAALQRSHWNVSQAARALRIGRKTLYRKMHKHQLLRTPAQT